MKTEKVINYLREKNFNQYQFEESIMAQIEDLNIDIWSNESKLVMLKEYRTKTTLLNWKQEDQVCIASALQYIPKKYINNLYFFMVLDFNSDEVQLRLEVNKIEKNELICKNYILKDQEDLSRVPFLVNVLVENKAFDFDEKFKGRIMHFKDESERGNVLNIEVVMDNYFNNYLKDKQNFNVQITDLIEMGD